MSIGIILMISIPTIWFCVAGALIGLTWDDCGGAGNSGDLVFPLLIWPMLLASVVAIAPVLGIAMLTRKLARKGIR